MNTVVVARAHAALLAVADVALLALAGVGAVRVVADGVLVAVVQAEPALVHVGALRVGPARVGRAHVERGGAGGARAREVALGAHAVDGVLLRVAPAATHGAQAGGAVRVCGASLALSGGRGGRGSV